MAKIDKILSEFLKKPTSNKLTLQDVRKVMNYYDYFEISAIGGSSGVKFVNKEKKIKIINFHKPHPKKEVPEYVVERVRELILLEKNKENSNE